MHCSSPRASAGLSMLEASIAPSAAPAPTIVCSSSMKRITFLFCAISFITALSRSSNWPRYLVPAMTAAMSSVRMRCLAQRSGHSPFAMSCASPSTIAVLPTPGSPISTGLFFLRRDSTSMTRSISFARPMVGSSLPSRGELREVAAEVVERRRLGLLLALRRGERAARRRPSRRCPPRASRCRAGAASPRARLRGSRPARAAPAPRSPSPRGSGRAAGARCRRSCGSSARASLIASSSTLFARGVYGSSGPMVCAAFPFLTISSIFCWISSRSTPRFFSTAAATPSPSRMRPSRIARCRCSRGGAAPPLRAPSRGPSAPVR